MKTIMAIEMDPHAAATYSANFPGVTVLQRRVEDCVSMLPSADVVIGGPPCQSFSLAGDGLGEFDPRNGWPAALAAVAKVMPRMFLFENVAGMLTKKHIGYLRKVFTAFERIGYRVEMKRLNSVNFGVPQFRDRIWLWGIRNDLTARHCWPAPTHAWPWPEPGMFGDHGLARAVTTGWALGISHRQADGVWFEGSGCPPAILASPSPSLVGGSAKSHTNGLSVVNDKNFREEFGKVHEYRWSDAMLTKHPPAPPAPPASPASAVQAKYAKGGAEGLVEIVDDPKHQPHQPANSLRSGGKGNGMPNTCRAVEALPCETICGTSREPIQNWKAKKWVRRLTPSECARLMSMPDDFKWPAKISKTAMYRIIGNGQCSLMAHHMAQALAAADPQSETVISLFAGGGVGDVGFHGRYWEFSTSPQTSAPPETKCEDSYSNLRVTARR